ncbi:TetR/AcrR family transcriptional regulator [Actinomycetospora chiangmaiensis]|uniref:TetR/AcrR family transcriptional regulator n=1 Tax=Actinomycetospora chiangmaiensis TaxID=402650 RepID=UPI0003614946|nr:TetR/AcrR family transcriptional regulator [Actinomycetospora chiangmaiensis]
MTDAPATPSRIERKRAQRVAELERAAARLFAQRGYDRTNFEDVAAELDLRGPSLYHYFSSKDDLLRRCLRSSSEEVLGRLRAIADTPAPPADLLRALFREQVLIEVRDFPEFAPLFLTMPVSVPDIRELVLEVRRAHAAIFEDVAHRVVDGLGPDALRVRMSVVFGALAYIPEWYDPAGSLAPEALADELADTLLALFSSSR